MMLPNKQVSSLENCLVLVQNVNIVHIQSVIIQKKVSNKGGCNNAAFFVF